MDSTSVPSPTHSYPDGYLDATSAFLKAASASDPVAVPCLRVPLTVRPARKPVVKALRPTRRVVASFAVVVIASLSPLVGLLVTLFR